MNVAFILMMPSRSSWNGSWSGDHSLFVKTRNFRSKRDIEKAKKLLKQGNFSYSFGDGWVANISISEVDTKEARKLRKNSKGFAGYDWMINSILNKGLITTL